MTDDGALAVDGEDFDLDLGWYDAASEGQGVFADCVAEGDASGAGHRQGLLAGVGLANALLQCLIGTDGGCPLRQLWQVDT